MKPCACFDLNGLRYIGEATLDPQEEQPGAGHVFGDVCYTFVRADGDILYFKKDAHQPFLELD